MTTDAAKRLSDARKRLEGAQPALGRLWDDSEISPLLDDIERLSAPPSQGKLSEEFLANIYVQSWDQHIGRDGAIAILNALAATNQALTEPAQGMDAEANND